MYTYVYSSSKKQRDVSAAAMVGVGRRVKVALLVWGDSINTYLVKVFLSMMVFAERFCTHTNN